MAWFNTDWNLGNMFNSPYGSTNTSNNPYGFTGSGVGGNMIVPWSNSVTGETWDAPNTGYQPPNSDWQMVNSQKGTLGGQNSVWGAPAYYQAPNTSMFGNNPYQAQDGGFYNPNIFGQMSYPSQYNTNQQPWWMNYNTNNSIIDNSLTTNMPTSTQPDPSVIPRPGGTGPGGKDLTHAETIKYFGLYDDAEKAFAAGDKQAAYRKDHMHWRAGTGAWAGNGKQEGQSDLDYPGRTTANGDVIMGDRQKLGDWSNMGNNIQNYFKAKQMFNVTANDQGGNDYTVKNDGTLTTNDGTIIETQVMSAEEKAAQDEMLKKQDLELKLRRMAETRNPFDRETNYFYPSPISGFSLDKSYPYVPSDDGPFNYPSTLNTNSVYPYVPSDDGPFNYSSTLNTNPAYPYVPSDDGPFNYKNENPLITKGPFTAEEQLKRELEEQKRYAETDGKINARWESEQISKALRKQTLDNDPFIRKLVADGMLSMDQVPFPSHPGGKTVGNMTYPIQDEDINIFSGGDKDALLNIMKDDIATQGYTTALPKTEDHWTTEIKNNAIDAVKAYSSGYGMIGKQLFDMIVPEAKAAEVYSPPSVDNEKELVDSSNIFLKDKETFQPRVTAPAKKAAEEKKKKVVKKATPKRVTVNYNKNRPVAVKSKPTRTPAPKVTRTTGSRGGRGNVAKKRKTYTSKGGW